FDILANLRYTRGEQSVGGIDEPADRIPPLGGRVSVNYATGGPLSTTAWVEFAGAQERLSARDVDDVRIDPNGTPGWVTVGARAQWQTPGGWLFGVGLDNLFDKRFRHHGSGLDAPGRNLSLSVRRSW
ncbi:MAG: colicin I receptor, partial [Pseudomonadota bacterium]